MILFTLFLSCFLVVLPLAGDVEGDDSGLTAAGSYRVVDLVAPDSGRPTTCPETSLNGAVDDLPCLMSGVVDEVRVEPKKITVRLNNEYFCYLVGENAMWEMGGPLNLFMASKINRVPVSLRFQNWGGIFYVTQASL